VAILGKIDSDGGKAAAVLIELWQSNPVPVLMVTHNIREAVVLADRIIIMSQRPAHVLGTSEIAVPRAERSLDEVEALGGAWRAVSGDRDNVRRWRARLELNRWPFGVNEIAVDLRRTCFRRSLLILNNLGSVHGLATGSKHHSSVG
jgi:energy-coupling factor transporter ATP-binding protein EcfA2